MRTCSSDQLELGKLTRSLARCCLPLEMNLPNTPKNSSHMLDNEMEVQE
jgi:hypothetical protein